MKLFVRLFAVSLLSFAAVMLYTSLTSKIEVLEEGRVTAKSRYSEKIVRAPSRKIRRNGREFWQVKTPGGGWYDCRNNDCPETLRVEYVDHAFNHQQSPEPGTLSPYQKTD